MTNKTELILAYGEYKNGKFGPYGLLGSGPFVLDEYKPGEFVMMKRNDNYRMLQKKSGKTE